MVRCFRSMPALKAPGLASWNQNVTFKDKPTFESIC